MISSVESGKGYCKKFLEMWEKYARENGYSALIISHVDNDALEHILEKKRRVFSFWKRRPHERKVVTEKTFHHPTVNMEKHPTASRQTCPQRVPFNVGITLYFLFFCVCIAVTDLITWLNAA